MKPIIDVDKLDKQHNKKIVLFTISSVIILALMITGFVLYSHKKSLSHLAPITGGTSSANTSGATSTIPLNTDQSSSANSSSLTQEEAQDKALAAQKEAEAQQDLKNAEQLGETGTQTTPSTLSSTPASTISTPNLLLCPGIEAQEQLAVAPYSAQAQQLQATLQSEEQVIDSNPSSEAATEASSEMKSTTNQLDSLISQISAIDTQYETQLAENECS